MLFATNDAVIQTRDELVRGKIFPTLPNISEAHVHSWRVTSTDERTNNTLIDVQTYNYSLCEVFTT